MSSGVVFVLGFVAGCGFTLAASSALGIILVRRKLRAFR